MPDHRLYIEFKKGIVTPEISGRFAINSVRKFKSKFLAVATRRFAGELGGEAGIDATIAFKC